MKKIICLSFKGLTDSSNIKLQYMTKLAIIYLPVRFFSGFLINVISFVIPKNLFGHGHRFNIFYQRNIKSITTKVHLSTTTNNHIMIMQERATEEESYIKVLSHFFIMYFLPSFKKEESTFKALVSCNEYFSRKQNKDDV
jgi:hypothetical protein